MNRYRMMMKFCLNGLLIPYDCQWYPVTANSNNPTPWSDVFKKEKLSEVWHNLELFKSARTHLKPQLYLWWGQTLLIATNFLLNSTRMHHSLSKKIWSTVHLAVFAVLPKFFGIFCLQQNAVVKKPVYLKHCSFPRIYCFWISDLNACSTSCRDKQTDHVL